MLLSRVGKKFLIIFFLLLIGGPFPASGDSAQMLAAVQVENSPAESMANFCRDLPRKAYTDLARLDSPDDWFELYRVAPGVTAIYEPHQWQEVISYLIEGRDRALLFDSGNGIADIAAVVANLTSKPVTVLNSHSHYDHVGGNYAFARVLAMATPFTDQRALGRSNAQIRIEVSPAALCRPLPAGVSEDSHTGRAYQISARVKDGEVIDLGGRQLEIMHVPGHTPDAIVLLDRAAGLMWTGDSYYSGPIWLYAPETDLAAYRTSLARMVIEVPNLRALLPAHNTPRVEPSVLLRVQAAFDQLMARELVATEAADGTVVYAVTGEKEFSFLLAEGALENQESEQEKP